MARISKTNVPVVPPQPAAAKTSTSAAATSSMSNAVSSFSAASKVSQAPAAQGGGTLHFDVNPGMNEVQNFAKAQGWPQKGWTDLSTYGQDIVYTTDNWKTTRSLNSSQVPSPFVNGRIILPDVAPGTQVQFALHVYVASHAPSDIGGYRERSDMWLNNNGQNYTQTAS
jgi:hypothetical protein